MSDKYRVCVELFHRNQYSIGLENRERYNWAIYHWAILIRPKDISKISQSTTHDATDAAQPTADGTRDLNPDGDWRFRTRSPIDPVNTGHFLVAIILGKLPKNFTSDQITALLARTSLPQKGHFPEQNCVTWTRDAIIALQGAGLVDDTLHVHDIMKVAFQKADIVMRNGPPRNPSDRFIDLGVLRHEIETMKNGTQEDEVTEVPRSATARRSRPQISTFSLAAEAASAKAAFLRFSQRRYQ